MENIGIIGAGPAGLMAAISAKTEDNRVSIIDSNDDIGRKLRLTGGGRCNITNAKYYEDFLENIVRNKKFFYSAFSKFDNFALIDFLSDNGVKTTVEDDGRVFPKSERADRIIDFLKEKIRELEINFIKSTKVRKITYDGIFILETNVKNLVFDKVVVATGGMSYKNTGSDGSGYNLVRELGHKIVSPRPVLVPIYLKKNLGIRALSLEDIGLSLKDSGQSLRGDIMINNDFLTGPLALKASSYLEESGGKEISLDFLPDKSFNEIDDILIKLTKKNPKKSLLNVLRLFLNENIARMILSSLKADSTLIVSELSKDLRISIGEKIKGFDLNVKNLAGFNTAIITRGGIDTKEINPKTMESKLVKNLYFAGEIIDMDALTGGFNLQISFSTGFVAGSNIKEK